MNNLIALLTALGATAVLFIASLVVEAWLSPAEPDKNFRPDDPDTW